MKKRFVLFFAVVSLAFMVAPATALAKVGTYMTVDLSSKYEYYDLTPTLSVRLRTEWGRPLGGQTVHLYRDGVKVASKRTNAGGAASFVVKIPAEDYDSVWQVAYSGTAKYASCRSERKKTRIYVRCLMSDAVGFPVDHNRDGVPDGYLVTMTLSLDGDSTYEIYTSTPTFRFVFRDDSNVDLYPGETRVKNGEFFLASDGVYDVMVESPDNQPFLLLVW